MEGYENYDVQNNATSSGAYENYDSNDNMSPYQMLMQMKSWNEAVYIYVDDIDKQTKAQLTVMSDRITAEVSDLNQELVSYVDQTASAITTEVNDFKNSTTAQFQVQAGQIASKVASTDYNGNTIASLINQTATTVQITASKINLSGYVTVSSLSSTGTTTIHGDRIQTGTLNANKIVANTITGDKLAFGTITASKIASNTITSAEIASNAITANELSTGAVYAGAIQSGAIQSYHITAGAITAGAIQSGAIQAYHIQAGAITADMISTGYLSANRISGGTLSGVTINVSTDATIGRYLYMGGTSSSGTKIDGRSGYFEVETDYRIMLDSAYVALVVDNLANATINGYRILTTQDL